MGELLSGFLASIDTLARLLIRFLAYWYAFSLMSRALGKLPLFLLTAEFYPCALVSVMVVPLSVWFLFNRFSFSVFYLSGCYDSS